MKLLLTTFQYCCSGSIVHVIAILVTLLARHNMTFIINLENCVAFSCEIDPNIRHKVSVQMGERGTYYRETTVHVTVYLASTNPLLKRARQMY